MKESILCTTYMYLSNPPKIIIDINFQAVNLKKDKKNLIFYNNLLLRDVSFILPRICPWGLLLVLRKTFITIKKIHFIYQIAVKNKFEWLILRQCHHILWFCKFLSYGSLTVDGTLKRIVISKFFICLYFAAKMLRKHDLVTLFSF